MGSGRLPTPTFSWVRKPAFEPGAGARPGRVTHCCFEHAGQNFGSLDRGPQATRPECECVWRTSEVGKQASLEPEEIPDAEHELVIERVARDRCGQGVGQGVRAGAEGARSAVSRVWDVAATTGAVTELADQLMVERIEKVTVIDLGLLADLVLPAGSGGAVGAAGQRPRREERARDGRKPTSSTRSGWPS